MSSRLTAQDHHPVLQGTPWVPENRAAQSSRLKALEICHRMLSTLSQFQSCIIPHIDVLIAVVGYEMRLLTTGYSTSGYPANKQYQF